MNSCTRDIGRKYSSGAEKRRKLRAKQKCRRGPQAIGLLDKFIRSESSQATQASILDKIDASLLRPKNIPDTSKSNATPSEPDLNENDNLIVSG